MKSPFTLLVALAVTTVSVNAAIGSQCFVNNVPGVCLTTTTCSSGGGTSTAGYCPNDPANVRCCTKACGSGGRCRTVNSCVSGNILSGLCPGDSNVKCCLPASAGCSSGPAVNTATLNLVKASEGWRPNIYTDPAGLATVGYGHLCQKAKCAEVPYSIPLSVADGTRLLQSDMKTAQNCLAKAVSVKLNANQYGALVSWTFNVGCGAMRGSALVERLNKGQTPNTVASEELPRWNKGGGKVLPGLVTRRAKEVTLFKTATTAKGIPC